MPTIPVSEPTAGGDGVPSSQDRKSSSEASPDWMPCVPVDDLNRHSSVGGTMNARSSSSLGATMNVRSSLSEDVQVSPRARGSQFSIAGVSAVNRVTESMTSAFRFFNVGTSSTPLRKQVTRTSVHSHVNKAAEADEEYVDQLRPEDVGLSFCCRAAANFSKGKPAEGDAKHLYGLNDYFPEEKRKPSDRISHSESASDSLINGSWMFISRSWRKSSGDSPVQGQVAKSSRSGKKDVAASPHMRFAATSAAFLRCKLFLTASATVSCLYVIGSCSVAASCEYGGISYLGFAHLINSIMYGLVSILSRFFFTRVNWRQGEQLTLPSEVFMSHLRSPGLSCDLLSLIGLAAEIVYFVGDYAKVKKNPLPTTAQWTMLLQLLKVWRVALPEDVSQDKRQGFFQGLVRLLFLLFTFSHLVACLLLLMGNFEVTWGHASWLDDTPYNLDMTHCTVRYVEAFHFAVIGLTAVGYQDLLVTAAEHGMNTIILLLSFLVAASVCADLTWLTSMYNQHKTTTHERRRRLLQALDRMGVPKVLVTRVLAYENYEHSMHADNMDQEAFQGLSKNLIVELKLCAYRTLVLQAPFLRMQPTEVISSIVKELRDVVYLPSDFIVRTGEHGRELFFVRRGEAKAYIGTTVPVWGQSQEVGVIKTGNYFGELAMLTGLARGSFVMASFYCVCSILPYSAVEYLMEEHPESFTTLVQSMVAMYNLKPSSNSWRTLSAKIGRRYNLNSDRDAFAWFQQQDITIPDTEMAELSARAFDVALQQMNVSQLDRRIFWSELDIDASGGISFEEFTSKFRFANDDDAESEVFSATCTDNTVSDSRLSSKVLTKGRSQSFTSSRCSSPPPEPTAADQLRQRLVEQNKQLQAVLLRLKASKRPSEKVAEQLSEATRQVTELSVSSV